MRIAGSIGLMIEPVLPGFWKKAQTKADAQKRPTLEMPVEADTKKAYAQLAAFRAREQANQINLRVGIDENSIRKAEDRVRYIEHTWKQSDIKRAIRVNIFVAGATALPALTQGLLSVTAAMTTLSRAALVLPGILAGVGAAAGTLTIGFRGVAEALKQYNQGLDNSEQSARQYARATRDLQRAQRDVVQAFKDANREIQDQKDALAQGQLSVEQARLNVQRANEALAKGGFKSMTDYQQALLDVKQANLNFSLAVKDATRDVQDYYENAGKAVGETDRVKDSLDGLTDAIDNYRKAQFQAAGMSDQFISAMKKLSPAGQDFVLELTKMKGALRGLQQSVETTLVSGLGRSITDLANKQLPMLKTGMQRVAAGLNADFKQIFETLGSTQNSSAFAKIFDRTGAALNALRPGIDSLINGFVKLTEVGSRFLPRLAQAFNIVAERFESFIDRTERDGSLERWIDRGLDLVSSLGRSLLNIGSILGSLTQAYDSATGNIGGFATTMERALSRWAAYLSSPKGQTAIINWIRESRDFMAIIKETLPGIRQIFQALGDGARLFAEIAFPIFSELGNLIGNNAAMFRRLIALYLGFRTIKPFASTFFKGWRDARNALTTYRDKLKEVQATQKQAQANLGKARLFEMDFQRRIFDTRQMVRDAEDVQRFTADRRKQARLDLIQARRDSAEAKKAMQSAGGSATPAAKGKKSLYGLQPNRAAAAQSAQAAATAKAFKRAKEVEADALAAFERADDMHHSATLRRRKAMETANVSLARNYQGLRLATESVKAAEADLARQAGANSGMRGWIQRMKMGIGSSRGGGLAGALGGLIGVFGRVAGAIGSVGTTVGFIYALDQLTAAQERARSAADNLKASEEALAETLSQGTGSATTRTIQENSRLLQNSPDPYQPDDRRADFDAAEILQRQLGISLNEAATLSLPTQTKQREARLAPADAQIIAAVPNLNEWKQWGQRYRENGVDESVFGRALNGDRESIGKVEAARQAIKDSTAIGRSLNMGAATGTGFAPDDLGAAQQQLSKDARELSLATGRIRGLGAAAAAQGAQIQRDATAIRQPGLNARGQREFSRFRLGPGGAVVNSDGSATIEVDLYPDSKWIDNAINNGIQVERRMPDGAIITISPESVRDYFNPGQYARGGSVWGAGTATSDSIPAMLSNGEFVINAKAASIIGHDRLQRMNQMDRLPAFAPGGPVDKDILFGSGGDGAGNRANTFTGPVVTNPSTLPEAIGKPTSGGYLFGPGGDGAAGRGVRIHKGPSTLPEAIGVPTPAQPGIVDRLDTAFRDVMGMDPVPRTTPAAAPLPRVSTPVDSSPKSTPLTHGYDGKAPGPGGTMPSAAPYPSPYGGAPARLPSGPVQTATTPTSPDSGAPNSGIGAQIGPSGALYIPRWGGSGALPDTLSINGRIGTIASKSPTAQINPNAHILDYLVQLGNAYGMFVGSGPAKTPEGVKLAQELGIWDHGYPDGGQHDVNRAIDYGSLEQAKQGILTNFVKDWMSDPDKVAATRQLIFQDPRNGEAFGIINGRVLDAQEVWSIYGDTLAGHQDHIHLALEGVPMDAFVPGSTSGAPFRSPNDPDAFKDRNQAPPWTPKAPAPSSAAPSVPSGPAASSAYAPSPSAITPPAAPPPMVSGPAGSVPPPPPLGPAGFDPINILREIGIAILKAIFGFFGIDISGILEAIPGLNPQAQEALPDEQVPLIPQPDQQLVESMEAQAEAAERQGQNDLADQIRQGRDSYLAQFDAQNLARSADDVAAYFDSIGQPDVANQIRNSKSQIGSPATFNASGYPVPPGAPQPGEKGFAGLGSAQFNASGYPVPAGAPRPGEKGFAALSGTGGRSLTAPKANYSGGTPQIHNAVYRAFKEAGYPDSEWPALVELLNHENDTWDPTRPTGGPNSDARGIFQFLSTTWGEVGMQASDDPYTQAVAGMRYIKKRYGTPSGAWNFWQNIAPTVPGAGFGRNWYSLGGLVALLSGGGMAQTPSLPGEPIDPQDFLDLFKLNHGVPITPMVSPQGKLWFVNPIHNAMGGPVKRSPFDGMEEFDPWDYLDQTYGTGILMGRPDGMPYLVDPIMNAQGGYVRGPGTATSDSIPALLSDGEFVMRAAAVKHWGVDRLKAMNAAKFSQGGLVGYNDGGSVGGTSVTDLLLQSMASGDSSSAVSSESYVAPSQSALSGDTKSALAQYTQQFGNTAAAAPAAKAPSGSVTAIDSRGAGLGLGPTPNVNATPGFQASQNLNDWRVGVGGVASGLIEGPIAAITDPVGTVKAMAPLVGLNGANAAGEAWKEVGKSFVAWDDWEDNPWGALGTTMANVGTIGFAGRRVPGQIKSANDLRQTRKSALEGIEFQLDGLGWNTRRRVKNALADVRAIGPYAELNRVVALPGTDKALVNPNSAKGAYASANPYTKEMALNLEHFGNLRDFKKSIRRGISAGYHPRIKDPIRGTIAHEYGHFVDFSAGLRMKQSPFILESALYDEFVREALRESRSAESAISIGRERAGGMRDAIDAVDDQSTLSLAFGDWIRGLFSKYSYTDLRDNPYGPTLLTSDPYRYGVAALQSIEPLEAFADAFSDVMVNKSRASYGSKLLYQIYRDSYGFGQPGNPGASGPISAMAPMPEWGRPMGNVTQPEYLERPTLKLPHDLAAEWMNRNWPGKNDNPYSKAELRAIQEYIAAPDVNEALIEFRRNPSLEGIGDARRKAILRHLEMAVPLLDSAFAKSPQMPVDFMVTRMTGEDSFGDAQPVMGQTYSHPGYMSTTAGIRNPEDWREGPFSYRQHMITGLVPKGTPAIWLGGNLIPNAIGGEGELLLPRGTSYSAESVVNLAKDSPINPSNLSRTVISSIFAPTRPTELNAPSRTVIDLGSALGKDGPSSGSFSPADSEIQKYQKFIDSFQNTDLSKPDWLDSASDMDWVDPKYPDWGLNTIHGTDVWANQLADGSFDIKMFGLGKMGSHKNADIDYGNMSFSGSATLGPFGSGTVATDNAYSYQRDLVDVLKNKNLDYPFLPDITHYFADPMVGPISAQFRKAEAFDKQAAKASMLGASFDLALFRNLQRLSEGTLDSSQAGLAEYLVKLQGELARRIAEVVNGNGGEKLLGRSDVFWYQFVKKHFKNNDTLFGMGQQYWDHILDGGRIPNLAEQNMMQFLSSNPGLLPEDVARMTPRQFEFFAMKFPRALDRDYAPLRDGSAAEDTMTFWAESLMDKGIQLGYHAADDFMHLIGDTDQTLLKRMAMKFGPGSDKLYKSQGWPGSQEVFDTLNPGGGGITAGELMKQGKLTIKPPEPANNAEYQKSILDLNFKPPGTADIDGNLTQPPKGSEPTFFGVPFSEMQKKLSGDSAAWQSFLNEWNSMHPDNPWPPPEGMAAGGFISGPGSQTSDSIPAMLSNGEYVLNAKAVKHWGLDRLDAMNALRGYAVGGPVSIKPLDIPPPPPMDIPKPEIPPPPSPNDPDAFKDQVQPSPTGSADPDAFKDLSDIPDAANVLGGALGGVLAPKGGGSGGSASARAPQAMDPRAILGAAPSGGEHNNPALSGAIRGAWATVGSLASTAVSAAITAAAAGGSFGAAAPAAPAAGAVASQLISAGTQMIGNVASGAANVISSLLVGTVTPSQTGQGYGAPLLPQAPPSPVNNFQSIHNGNVVTNNLSEYNRLKDRKDAQKAAPFFNRVNS